MTPWHTRVASLTCIIKDIIMDDSAFSQKSRFFFSISKIDCFIYTAVLQAVKNYNLLLTSLHK